MKLYLRSQIEDRALEVWETPERLEEELEKREGKREQAKVKKFNKKLKALRMQVRGSLYQKKDLGGHQHEFGEEGYDQEEDEYFKRCKTCDFVQRYEKMWLDQEMSYLVLAVMTLQREWKFYVL